MTSFGCADEIIVSNIEIFPDWLPCLFDERVTPLLRRNIVLLGGIENFLTVFICSGEEPDRFTALAVPTG